MEPAVLRQASAVRRAVARLDRLAPVSSRPGPLAGLLVDPLAPLVRAPRVDEMVAAALARVGVGDELRALKEGAPGADCRLGQPEADKHDNRRPRTLGGPVRAHDSRVAAHDPVAAAAGLGPWAAARGPSVAANISSPGTCDPSATAGGSSPGTRDPSAAAGDSSVAARDLSGAIAALRASSGAAHDAPQPADRFDPHEAADGSPAATGESLAAADDAPAAAGGSFGVADDAPAAAGASSAGDWAAAPGPSGAPAVVPHDRPWPAAGAAEPALGRFAGRIAGGVEAVAAPIVGLSAHNRHNPTIAARPAALQSPQFAPPQGLAALVAAWHGGGATTRPQAPAAPQEHDVERALEHLLRAELDRHGIEVDAG